MRLQLVCRRRSSRVGIERSLLDTFVRGELGENPRLSRSGMQEDRRHNRVTRPGTTAIRSTPGARLLVRRPATFVPARRVRRFIASWMGVWPDPFAGYAPPKGGVVRTANRIGFCVRRGDHPCRLKDDPDSPSGPPTITAPLPAPHIAREARTQRATEGYCNAPSDPKLDSVASTTAPRHLVGSAAAGLDSVAVNTFSY